MNERIRTYIIGSRPIGCEQMWAKTKFIILKTVLGVASTKRKINRRDTTLYGGGCYILTGVLWRAYTRITA
jgi:hypothetical protein